MIEIWEFKQVSGLRRSTRTLAVHSHSRLTSTVTVGCRACGQRVGGREYHGMSGVYDVGCVSTKQSRASAALQRHRIKTACHDRQQRSLMHVSGVQTLDPGPGRCSACERLVDAHSGSWATRRPGGGVAPFFVACDAASDSLWWQ